MAFEDLPLWMRIWIGIGLLLIILIPLTCLLIGLLDPGMPDDAGWQAAPTSQLAAATTARGGIRHIG